MPSYKNMHSLVGCMTGYIGILWKISGILWFGDSDMVSLEKHPVFLDCYRLVLGRASSRKTLLCGTIWRFSMQFSVKGGLETTSLKVSLTLGLVLDVGITRSLVSYHIKILERVGTTRGRTNEIVEVMSKHKCWSKEEVPDTRCSR